MKILYADKKTPLNDILNMVKNPAMALSFDITEEIPYTDYLSEKVTNYSLSPSRFNVICDDQENLKNVLESISYKELTWDILKDALLHGGSAESWFLNQSGEIKVKKLNPLHLIILKETPYDEAHTVVYWETLPSNKIQSFKTSSFFEDKRVFIDQANCLSIWEKGNLVEEINHNLGFSSINVLTPFKGDPFFEKQIKLLKEYENTFDFLFKESRSTLNILMLPSRADSIRNFGDLRVIENISLEEGKPELLVKSPEYEAMFRLKEMIERRLDRETGVIDFSSEENASQEASGAALKLRLQTLEDKCQSIYARLEIFLKNRHRIISRLGDFPLKEEEVSIRLKTNLPESSFDKITPLGQMLSLGLVSRETVQEELGLDPNEEESKIEEESRQEKKRKEKEEKKITEKEEEKETSLEEKAEEKMPEEEKKDE